MISGVKAQQFLTLFMGKSNTYVKNELPKEKPAPGQKTKTKITNNEGKVDKELILRHLEGDFGVGVCPVDADGKARMAVLDIDSYGDSTRKMLSFIREFQLPLVPFRSKSGGLHVYMFLTKAVQARKAREALARVSWFFCLEEIYGKGKVEVFPKQDKAEGFGSSITLPYFNAENPYTYMLDLDGNMVPFDEALVSIQKKITTLEALSDALSALPFNDAPPCLQRILLSGCVGGEDSGRNNFLFSFAVYAKKKYGTGFEDYVKEVNCTFNVPLEEAVVSQICTSVSANEYMYKCKDIPCSSFCDKVVCKKREFGIGRDKGHFTGIQYGQLYRYLTAEPYYIWKLRLQGQEEWKDVLFKDEGFILDQKNFAKMCVRYLNRAPMQVSPNDWYDILNSILPNIIDVKVNKESDTSATSLIRNAFISYLSNKQARRDSPYQVKVGLCVRQTKEGTVRYFFTHRGFTEYLRNQKIAFDYSTMREMLKSFGAVEDTLFYLNAHGEEVSFPCWSKTEDKDINEAYLGAVEVEEGDRAGLELEGVSEASPAQTFEDIVGEEKPYTDKDMEEAEELF